MFKKVDAVVVKETRFIAAVVLIGSLLMQAVFLILSMWDYTVLLGNLVGAAAAILNFFLMALAVVKSLDMAKDDAAKHMRGSHGMRMLMLFCICAIGAAAPCFHTVAVLVPLVMPSIGAKIHGLMVKDDPNNPPHAIPYEEEEEELQ